MAIVRWEPFRELTAIQNEMSRLMGQFLGAAPAGNSSSTWLPALDVWETDDELVLAFELPGIPEDKITIEVDNDVLTVSGERERTLETTNDRFYRFERRYGTFQRSVSLPSGVDPERIVAENKDGVLEVHVPKPEEAKPKRISIGTKGTIEGSAKRAA